MTHRTVDVISRPYPKGKIVAIGDAHGCIAELNELIGRLQLAPEDLVVFLGDLVDRGPDSEGVVQRVMQLKAICNIYCVVGNHDEKCVRYHKHFLKRKGDPEYKIPMRCPSSYLELSTSSLEFLTPLPHAVFIDNKGTQEPYPLCFVHAGLSPALFSQEPSAFIRNRYFTKNVKDNRITPVKSIEINDVWYVPEGSYPWHHYYSGKWTVLYGHSVSWYPEVNNNTIACDGGCCFGGCLRAWVKEHDKDSYFVEVASKNS